MAQNESYPTRDRLKLYRVPLKLLAPGKNRIELENPEKKRGSCQFFSLELALYRNAEGQEH